MNATFVRFVCRILIACLACLPFQAQADLVGTQQAAAAERLQPASVRAALADRIEALGVPGLQARERVAALTDAEVARLTGELDSLPAGAATGLFFGVLFVAIFLIWRFNFSDQAKAEKK